MDFDEDSFSTGGCKKKHQLADAWSELPLLICSILSHECSRATGCHVVTEISFTGMSELEQDSKHEA